MNDCYVRANSHFFGAASRGAARLFFILWRQFRNASRFYSNRNAAAELGVRQKRRAVCSRGINDYTLTSFHPCANKNNFSFSECVARTCFGGIKSVANSSPLRGRKFARTIWRFSQRSYKKMNELFISVDIEASGPIPGEYSMLSLGACVVGATHENFYVELKPLNKKFDAQALAIAGLNLKKLARTGVEPAQALRQFDAWLARNAPFDHTPIFCAYPLAFDWMFVAYYFHRFLGRNPFGYSGFDVKSFFMGASGKRWGDASVPQHFHDAQALTHNAREDAIAQAKLLERVFEYANKQYRPSTRR